MVGRLVEQQHVGLLQQQTAQRHTAAFTPGKGVDFLVVGRALQCVHGALKLGVDVPCIRGIEGILQFPLTLYESVHFIGILQHVGVAECCVDIIELLEQIHHRLHALAHNLNHRLFGVKFRFLLQVSHRVTWREHHIALEIFVDSGYYFQQ